MQNSQQSPSLLSVMQRYYLLSHRVTPMLLDKQSNQKGSKPNIVGLQSNALGFAWCDLGNIHTGQIEPCAPVSGDVCQNPHSPSHTPSRNTSVRNIRFMIESGELEVLAPTWLLMPC